MIKRFFKGLLFWSLVLISLVMLALLTAIILGFIPVKESS